MVNLAEGGGGSMPPMQSIYDSMNSFAMTAAAGDIEVSERGGDALIAVIEEFQNWVDSKGRSIDRLSQERMLGTSNGAKVMAPFLVTVATDGQGFSTRLRALSESLEKAKEGIRTAMKNYRATEEANQAKANKLEV